MGHVVKRGVNMAIASHYSNNALIGRDTSTLPPDGSVQHSRGVHHTRFWVAGWAMHALSRPSARCQHCHAPLHAPNEAPVF